MPKHPGALERPRRAFSGRRQAPLKHFLAVESMMFVHTMPTCRRETQDHFVRTCATTSLNGYSSSPHVTVVAILLRDTGTTTPPLDIAFVTGDTAVA